MNTNNAGRTLAGVPAATDNYAPFVPPLPLEIDYYSDDWDEDELTSQPDNVTYSDNLTSRPGNTAASARYTHGKDASPQARLNEAKNNELTTAKKYLSQARALARQRCHQCRTAYALAKRRAQRLKRLKRLKQGGIGGQHLEKFTTKRRKKRSSRNTPKRKKTKKPKRKTKTNKPKRKTKANKRRKRTRTRRR
jgi:hypothetical protein